VPSFPFRGRIAQAASLSIFTHFVGQALRLAGNLVMTRLLAPESFGLMSIVVVVQVTLALLSDIGLRTSIIQSERHDASFLNTAWTVQIIRGFGVWLFSLALAVALALCGDLDYLPQGSAWANPQLPSLLAVTAFGTAITGFQSTNFLTASRNLNLRRLITIELTGQVVGLSLMIALGVATRSIWSLVSAGLASTVVNVVLSHVYLPGIPNRLAWEQRARHDLFKFGVWVLASSATFVLASNADRLLLAGLVSATTLGLYSIALNLCLLIDSVGSRLCEHVMLPALSENRDDLPRRVLRLRLPLDIGYLASAGFILAVGPEVIELLYDQRYHAAGAMLQILSFSLVFSRYSVFSIAYLALGRPQLVALISCVKLVISVALLLSLNALFGTIGALCAVAFHSAAALPLYYFINRKYGLNNWGFELAVLPAWAAGYLGGLALQLIAT
jgi:O-antigen/teichoic acid export membrane protein